MSLYAEPIIDKCEGCAEVVTTARDGDNGEPVVTQRCRCYAWPAKKWTVGNCPRATHLVKQEVKEKKLNPLKQAKRERMGK